MEMEFVCLTNSRLRGGRSVAGLRTDGGGWVRIVGRNGPLSRKVCTMEDGREVGLMDVVQVEAESRVVNHQPENYEVDSPKPGILGALMGAASRIQPWKPAGRVELANAPGVLDPLIRKGPDLFGSQRDREELPTFDSRSVVTSLTMVEPDAPIWEIVTSFRGQGGERQIRARFILDGAEYSLPVTDPKWEDRCKILGYGAHTNFNLLVEEKDRVLLTVSLEEPDFSNNPAGECFKSVVGVILLPGAKGARGPERRISRA